MKMRKRELDETMVKEKNFLYEHRKEIGKLLDPFMSDKYFDIRDLLNYNSEYLIAFGEKSNGKSTAAQMVACIIYYLFKAETVLLRLYDEDFKKGRAAGMFKGLPSGFMKYITKGKYDSVIYRNFGWHFAKYNMEKDDFDIDPIAFCHRQCILNAGSSFQFPNVKFIIFDEFIRKDTLRNVPDEFVEFQTVVSTIKRNQTNIQIAMMGNTVNTHSVYFVEMGLKNVRTMQQGTTDLYTYGESGLSVAVQYCDTPKGKDSKVNKYFAFNNPKLSMITSGSWQLDIYPHLPIRYRPKDIVLTYYIKYDEIMFQADIVCRDNNLFTYIHDDLDNTPNFNEDIIYMTKDDARPNIAKNISKPMYDFQKVIWNYFSTYKVFYKNNEVGDVIHAYLKSCIG